MTEKKLNRLIVTLMKRLRGTLPPCFLCLVLTLCLGISGCKVSQESDDDLSAAKEAKIEQDWAHVARLTQRYLRSEMDPEKRWEAWQLIIEASEKMSESMWVVDYLEAALVEYDEFSPHYSELLGKLGSIYEESRQWDKAAAIWDRQLMAVDITPNSAAEIYRNQGRLYFLRHEFVAARERFQRCETNAVALDVLSSCIYSQADTYVAEEDYENALTVLEKVLAISGVPDRIRGMSLLLRGDIFEQQGKHMEAERDFLEALRFHPNPAAVETRLTPSG